MYRLKRFFIKEALEDNILVKNDVFSHLKVLRASLDDSIVFVNEAEIGVYLIKKISKNHLTAELVEKKAISVPRYTLKAYISVLKREYMDFVMEKMGEIGVTEVIPIFTKRSIRTLTEGTLSRYKKLLINGAMQSEIDFIPKLSLPADISDILADCGKNILFYERGAGELQKINSKSVSFFIGPEGGLKDEEKDMLLYKGFKIATPFSNILKAETAAVIFGGMLRYEIEKVIS